MNTPSSHTNLSQLSKHCALDGHTQDRHSEPWHWNELQLSHPWPRHWSLIEQCLMPCWLLDQGTRRESVNTFPNLQQGIVIFRCSFLHGKSYDTAIRRYKYRRIRSTSKIAPIFHQSFLQHDLGFDFFGVCIRTIVDKSRFEIHNAVGSFRQQKSYGFWWIDRNILRIFHYQSRLPALPQTTTTQAPTTPTPTTNPAIVAAKPIPQL